MPLQNRVAPDGTLHAVVERGMFTGNRGILHNPATKLLTRRRWTTRSWIVCSCEWKGRSRDVWGYQIGGTRPGWSELFFLDEVTALAAGHRPCFLCRRDAAKAYSEAFRQGNGLSEASARAIDLRLHHERWVSRRSKPRAVAGTSLNAQPNGTVICSGGRFYAVLNGNALPWGFAGYGPATGLTELAAVSAVTVVTPESTIAALRSGFCPVWHVTISGDSRS